MVIVFLFATFRFPEIILPFSFIWSIFYEPNIKPPQTPCRILKFLLLQLNTSSYPQASRFKGIPSF